METLRLRPLWFELALQIKAVLKGEKTWEEKWKRTGSYTAKGIPGISGYDAVFVLAWGTNNPQVSTEEDWGKKRNNNKKKPLEYKATQKKITAHISPF